MSILFAQRRRNAARKREFTARTPQSFDKAEIAAYNLTEPEKSRPETDNHSEKGDNNIMINEENKTNNGAEQAENAAPEAPEEVKEVDAVESEKVESEEKKGGFWKDVKKGFGDLWNKSKKFVKDSANTVSNYFSSQQEVNALNSIFEDEAKKFTDVKTGKARYALVRDGSLLFRKDGDGTVLNLRNDEIAAGTHLSADGKVYVITAVNADCKETFAKPGNSQSLELFSADYKLAD